MKQKKTGSFILLLFVGLLSAAPQMALAQCVDPVGDEGDQIYNTTHKVMQFCDGDEWVGMARVTPAPGTTGDNLGSHVAEQDLNANTFKVIDMGAPVNASDAATKAYIDSLIGTNEIDPQVGVVAEDKWCTSNGTLVNCESSGPELTPGLYVAAEIYPNNTDPGGAAATTWTDRVLNTEVYNNLTGASLAANAITLPAGTYYIDASSPFWGGITAQTRLVNATDDSVILYGTFQNDESQSIIRGTFELAAPAAVKVQYYASQYSGTNDLGRDVEAGIEESYAVVSIKQVASGVIAERPPLTCAASFTDTEQCDGETDPAQVLFSHSSGFDETACAAACGEAGATCCSHTSWGGCFGTIATAFSTTLPPAAPGTRGASLCADCEPATEAKHFFVLGPSDDGNINDGGQAGIPSGDRICLAYLQANDWMGKDEAVLDSSTVKSFLCDKTTCNNLQPSKTYAFAVAGNASLGGATFTTNASGAGPGDSANWSGPAYFGSSVSLWTNRAADTGTHWGTIPSSPNDNTTCYGFSRNNSNYSGREGSTNATNGSRWASGNDSCNTSNRIACFVDSPADPGTCGEEETCHETFTQTIAAGVTHGCGLAQNGTAYCWGEGGNGQIGDGETSTRSTPRTVVNGESSGKFYSIGTGSDLTCALEEYGGSIYCWGANRNGQTAQGTTSGDTTSPAKIENGESPGTFKYLGVGASGACAVGTDDYAYCWGDGSNGAIGDGYQTNRSTPRRVVAGASPGKFIAVEKHSDYSCGIGTDQKAYCWGDGIKGNGTDTLDLTPIAVSNGSGPGAYTQIEVGEQKACGLGTDQKAYCWGRGERGEMGDGSNTNNLTPNTVSNGQSPGTFTQITIGSDVGCGIGTDGKAYCWGNGGENAGEGFIGNGSQTDYNTPRTVSNGASPGTFKQISTQSVWACALATDNKSYCWGRNFYSYFGNGNTTNAMVPTATSNGNNATGTYQTTDPEECGDGECEPSAATPGYLVISDGTINGNLGGMAGADARCLSDLQSKNWKGKDNATLNASTVKAFLCTDDPSNECNNLLPNKEYFFAAMGSGTTGGSSFTTDGTGAGPNNSDDWSGATYFNTADNFWTGRQTTSSTKWDVTTPHNNTCAGWTSSSSGQWGLLGSADDNNQFRWERMSAMCNFTNRYVCAVHPAEATTCDGGGPSCALEESMSAFATDGTYFYANGKAYSYSNGTYTALTNGSGSSPGSSKIAVGQGKIFSSSGATLYAHTFNGTSFSAAGTVTIPSTTQIQDIFVDTNYIYVVATGGTNSLRSYSHSGSTFTARGSFTSFTGSPRGVWGRNNNQVFVREVGGNTFRAFTYNGTSFTARGTASCGGTGELWGDNSYIYPACNSSGMRAYTFNGTSLTAVGTAFTPGTIWNTWSDGTYIYAAGDQGVHKLTFNGSTFTVVEHYPDFGETDKISGGGSLVFAGMEGNSGVQELSCDGSGGGGGGTTQTSCTSAGGTWHDNKCWVYGASSASCDTACGTIGGTCNLANTLAVGTGGDNTVCNNALTALGASGSSTTTYNAVSAIGCVFVSLGRYRYTMTTTTCGGWLFSTRRACSCDLP